MFALEFPPINELLRWEDIFATFNKIALIAVAAALIGFAVLGAGKPNAFGTAIGALFVGILLQGLTMLNAPYYTQDFIKGAVLIVALVFTFALSGW